MKKLILLSSMLTTSSMASEVTIPNNFQANTPAVAADVNENFQALM